MWEAIAMRGVVAVESPDAAHRGRAAEAGSAQPVDDDLMHRLAVVPCRLGRVDRQLDHGRHVGRRQRIPGGFELRTAHELPLPFAQADLRDCHERVAEQAAQFGKEHRDPFPGPHGGDHEGHVGTVMQELSALSPPEVGAPNSGQHGRALDFSPVQQLAGRFVGRHLVDAVLAPAIQGELCRLAWILAERDQADLAGQQRHPPQGEQPGPGKPQGLAEQRLDVPSSVHGGHGQRGIVRQRQ